MSAVNDVIGPALPPQAEEDEKQFAEGKERHFHILNGFPMYKEEHLIKGRCMIFERIGWDDRVGPTYLALGPDNKELVLRISSKDKPVAKIEGSFLCQAELEGKWRLFSQVHSIFKHNGYDFLAVYFRGGPTLQQCFDFSKKKFSHGTGARLAYDVLEIVRAIHSLKYSVRRLELDSFHLDASSRHLFMADISDLRKTTTPDGKRIASNWVGGPLFAPLAVSTNRDDQYGITPRDEVESWFYMFLYMVHGLPWDGQCFEDIKWSKLSMEDMEAILKQLPREYRRIYDIIGLEGPEFSDEGYESVLALVKAIYVNAGVTDHDDNFDFEREPTADELPRFVMVPKNEDELADLDKTQESEYNA